MAGLLGRISREARLVSNMFRLLRLIGKIKPDSPHTVADILEHWAAARPDNVAILFEDRSYTYRDLEEHARRYAHWAQSLGLKRGDVVALLMENRPEYIFAWGGLIKLGVAVALINTNLRERSLAHSIAISGARHVVMGAEMADNYASAIDDMSERPTVWATGGKVQGANDLDEALARQPVAPLGADVRKGMTARDKCFYIYTSGTTGLPKAANMSHQRIQTMMHSFAVAMRSTEKDRMYVVLPLYHSAGGVCAI